MKKYAFVVALFTFYIASAGDMAIPDDFQPIEGSSEILYSYEFDEKPKFIARLNETDFIIMYIKDDEAKAYKYNAADNTVELKSEFPIRDGETLYDFQIRGNELHLLFRNYAGDIGNNNDGYYWRKTILDLTTYKPKSSRIIFTTIDFKKFELDEYNDDLEYADNFVDTTMFQLLVQGNQSIEIEPIEYVSFTDTYNMHDSSRFNYLSLINEDFSHILYARVTNFDGIGLSPKSYLVPLLDSLELKKNFGIQWTYLDDNSNLFFIVSWHDKRLKKRFISLNVVTAAGAFYHNIKELATEIDGDDDYVIHRFEPFSQDGNILKAMGISRFNGSESLEVQPISGIYIATINLKTLDFDLKSRTLTENEGNKINGRLGNLKFNIINKVIETENGYVVLAEHNKVHKIVNTVNPQSTMIHTSYNHFFHTINLFAMDKDLNIKWNRLIPNRDLHNFLSIWGQTLNPIDQVAYQTTLQPIVKDDFISFMYSTKQKEEVKRVKYNFKSGELVEETPFFKNDEIASFSPGY